MAMPQGTYKMAIPRGTYTDFEYSPEELEFLKAMDRYKKVNRRPHPTWREVFQVFMSLGYRKEQQPSACSASSVPLREMNGA